jgi:hypothetical protein
VLKIDKKNKNKYLVIKALTYKHHHTQEIHQQQKKLLHAKFQNPRTTFSWRKVTQGEERLRDALQGRRVDMFCKRMIHLGSHLQITLLLQNL